MAAPSGAPTATASPAPARATVTLVACMLVFFVITLDAVIVNVALPSVRAELGGHIGDLQWIVDGYTLMFAALLLSCGSMADRIGAKRLLLVGMALFILASIGCGLAPTMPGEAFPAEAAGSGPAEPGAGSDDGERAHVGPSVGASRSETSAWPSRGSCTTRAAALSTSSTVGSRRGGRESLRVPPSGGTPSHAEDVVT